MHVYGVYPYVYVCVVCMCAYRSVRGYTCVCVYVYAVYPYVNSV